MHGPSRTPSRKAILDRSSLLASGHTTLPDLRKDPITGRWVIIATDRARRPSDFTRERVVSTGGRICPFCPGQEIRTPPEVLAYRGSGAPNESGWSLRVVPNKFPALRVEGDLDRQGEGLYDRMNGVGAHEVIIETPDHLSTLSEMPEKQVADVFFSIRDRITDLSKDSRLRYIIAFKNHGTAAGATLEHPHSQLIALPVVPKRAQEELDGSHRYYRFRDRCIYCDILQQELLTHDRIVFETDHFLVIEAAFELDPLIFLVSAAQFIVRAGSKLVDHETRAFATLGAERA